MAARPHERDSKGVAKFLEPDTDGTAAETMIGLIAGPTAGN